jgi:formylglycine-generating enzyme required for sulfatase activity
MGVRQKGQAWLSVLWLLMAVTLVACVAGPPQAPLPEITGKDGAPMMLVPRGEFTMGSNTSFAHEQPLHRVTLDTFYMDKYEVTVGQYTKFLEATSLAAPPDWNVMNQPPHQNRPVVNVNWWDANSYCRWAGKRLPTEAEWEKAARGTDRRMYPWGNEPLDRLRANYGKEAWDDHAALAPVGSFEAGQSLYGIHDLAGNVWEWVSNWYDKDYYEKSPSQNPNGPEQGATKVLRGGSWYANLGYLKSTYRFSLPPSSRDSDFGFRCAKTP